MFKRILVAFDGSEHANRAAHVALDLAAKYSAHVTFLLVSYSLGSPGGVTPGSGGGWIMQTDDSSIIEQASNIALAKGLQDEDFEVVVETGHLAKTIVNYALRNDYDVIVLGRRGVGKVKALLLGSVSTEVLSLAKCTVITVT